MTTDQTTTDLRIPAQIGGDGTIHVDDLEPYAVRDGDVTPGYYIVVDRYPDRVYGSMVRVVGSTSGPDPKVEYSHAYGRSTTPLTDLGWGSAVSKFLLRYTDLAEAGIIPDLSVRARGESR